jgi:hypothetical protein
MTGGAVGFAWRSEILDLVQPLRDRLLRYRVTLVPHSSGDRVDWLPPLDAPGVYRFPSREAPTGVAELLADLELIDARGLDLGDLVDLGDLSELSDLDRHVLGLEATGRDATVRAAGGDDPSGDAPLADVVDLAAARARRATGPAPATGIGD